MKKRLLLINPTHKHIPNASWIKFYDKTSLSFPLDTTPSAWQA
jgi:hypothetical protein